jgi:hypothetical protein
MPWKFDQAWLGPEMSAWYAVACVRVTERLADALAKNEAGAIGRDEGKLLLRLYCHTLVCPACDGHESIESAVWWQPPLSINCQTARSSSMPSFDRIFDLVTSARYCVCWNSFWTRSSLGRGDATVDSQKRNVPKVGLAGARIPLRKLPSCCYTVLFRR